MAHDDLFNLKHRRKLRQGLRLACAKCKVFAPPSFALIGCLSVPFGGETMRAKIGTHRQAAE